jgi:hypothetical protein
VLEGERRAIRQCANHSDVLQDVRQAAHACKH